MSSATLTTVPAQQSRPRAAARSAGDGVTLGRVIRSEWTKLRSLRSTWVLLGIALLLGIGLGAAIAAATSGTTSSSGGPGGGGPTDTTAMLLAGTTLASLVLGVLGAMQLSGEYATGSITASLTAVPRRWMLLAGKAVVLVAVVAPVSFVMAFGAFGVGSSLLPASKAVSLGDSGVWAALIGATGYLTAVALLGLGLASLLRSTAGSITVLVALVFVAPVLLPLIPYDWVSTLASYLPSAAGGILTQAADDPDMTRWVASSTLVAWAIVPLAAGVALLKRRDA